MRARVCADGGRRRFDITPYGTETMHVLRAEKGYIIVGQDTDGSVTPFDLGMGGCREVEGLPGKRRSRSDTRRKGASSSSACSPTIRWC
jgi:sarcosine oxidase subunit alpha